MQRLLCLLLLTVSPAWGATVTNYTIDNFGNPLNAPLTITPLSTPTSNGIYVVNGPARTIQPTQGKASFTLLSGNYRVTQGTTSYLIAVPNDTNTYNINSLAISNLVIYSYTNGLGFPGLVRVSPSDTTPNYLGAELVAGTGIQFSTNTSAGNARLVIASTNTGTGDVAMEQLTTTSNALRSQITIATNDLANDFAAQLLSATNNLDPAKLLSGGAVSNQVLKFNGTTWAPGIDSTGTGGEGGIDEATAAAIAAVEAQKATNTLYTNQIANRATTNALTAGLAAKAGTNDLVAATNNLNAALSNIYNPLITEDTDLVFHDGYLRNIYGSGLWITNASGYAGWVGGSLFSSIANGTAKLTAYDGTTLGTLQAKVYATNILGGTVSNDIIWAGSNYFTGPIVVGTTYPTNLWEIYDESDALVFSIGTNGIVYGDGSGLTGITASSGSTEYVTSTDESVTVTTNEVEGVTGYDLSVAPTWTLVSTTTNGIAFGTNELGQLVATNTGPNYTLTNAGWGVDVVLVAPGVLGLTNTLPSVGGSTSTNAITNNHSVLVTLGAGLTVTGTVTATTLQGALQASNIVAGTITSNQISPTLHAQYIATNDISATYSMSNYPAWGITVVQVGTDLVLSNNLLSASAFDGNLGLNLNFTTETNDIIGVRDIYGRNAYMHSFYSTNAAGYIGRQSGSIIGFPADGQFSFTAWAGGFDRIKFGLGDTNVLMKRNGNNTISFRDGADTTAAFVEGYFIGNGSALSGVSAARLANSAYIGSGNIAITSSGDTSVGITSGAWTAPKIVATDPYGGGGIWGDGAAITNLNGAALSTGTIPIGRLGTGTPSASTVLTGDNAWTAEPWLEQTNGTHRGTLTVADSGSAFSAAITATATNATITYGDQQLDLNEGLGRVQVLTPFKAGGFITASNSFSSASTTLPMNYELTCVAAGNITINGTSGWQGGGLNETSLTIVPNGANRTINLPTQIRTMDGTRSFTCTNGTVSTLIVWGMPGVYTNASWQHHQ